MNPSLRRLLDSRVDGRAARVTSVLRIVVGVIFVFFGVLKFVFDEAELAYFVQWGFPDSMLIVYLVGLLEVAAGLMLIVGLATRLAALGLAVTMVGAILTAGLTEGGWFHLGFAPAMLAANLYLVWAGSGTRALDRRLALSPARI